MVFTSALSVSKAPPTSRSPVSVVCTSQSRVWKAPPGLKPSVSVDQIVHWPSLRAITAVKEGIFALLWPDAPPKKEGEASHTAEPNGSSALPGADPREKTRRVRQVGSPRHRPARSAGDAPNGCPHRRRELVSVLLAPVGPSRPVSGRGRHTADYQRCPMDGRLAAWTRWRRGDCWPRCSNH
jgi:hypothetical protein